MTLIKITALFVSILIICTSCPATYLGPDKKIKTGAGGFRT